MAPKILVVLTSVGKIDALDKPTGWYLPEFAHPYDVLAPKAELVIASPKGGLAPLDPQSIEAAKDASSVSFFETKKHLWENTKPLAEFAGRASEFDAIFFPGGHGPVFDLAFDEVSQKLIADFFTQGKVVAAVCHGPAVLANVKLPGGEFLVKGRKVTGFSNAEEEKVGMTEAMPFLLETNFGQKGAEYEKAGELWGSHVVVDGNLITGQNPASAQPIGGAILKALGL